MKPAGWVGLRHIEHDKICAMETNCPAKISRVQWRKSHIIQGIAFEIGLLPHARMISG